MSTKHFTFRSQELMPWACLDCSKAVRSPAWRSSETTWTMCWAPRSGCSCWSRGECQENQYLLLRGVPRLDATWHRNYSKRDGFCWECWLQPPGFRAEEGCISPSCSPPLGAAAAGLCPWRWCSPSFLKTMSRQWPSHVVLVQIKTSPWNQRRVQHLQVCDVLWTELKNH